MMYIYILGESEGAVDNEIYEIDYRGPETHSSVPPPHGHSVGKPLILHRSESSASVVHNHPKSKGSRKVNNMGRKVISPYTHTHIYMMHGINLISLSYF